MKKFKLNYNNGDTKGYIDQMVVLRKCELAKVINKCAENTHQKQIPKIRYLNGSMKEKIKMKLNSFRINNEWYNNDGSVYDKSKATLKLDDGIFSAEKVKELEQKLRLANEVECFYSMICFIFVI